MQLVNLSFAILVMKISFCVLPGVLGIYLLASSEESKRSLRNSFCNKVFGVSNAIAYPKFARFLNIFGGILLVFSLLASWFLLLKRYF